MDDNTLSGHSSDQIHHLFSRMKKSISCERTQDAAKFVITPIAQDVIPCGHRVEPETILRLVEDAFCQLRIKDIALYAILDLQFHYGLRISEVLGIKLTDVSTRGFIKVKGLKGSNDRIIYPILSLKYFSVCKERGRTPFQGIDRYYVYRIYQKLGIKIYLQDNKKYAVTHIFRYLNTQHLLDSFNDLKTTQEFIGHKRAANTKIYGNKK